MANFSLYTMILIGVVLGERVGQTKSFCIFGDSPDCSMPCHCSGESTTECNTYTGKCSSGCAKTKPDYYRYTGSSCQLGNLAYGKPTFSNSVINKTTKNYNRPHLWYNTNNTVDGLMKLRVFDGSCSVVYTDKKTTLPWMMVDLENMYTITKVTIINTDNSIDSSYLENFNLKVGNTSDIEEHQLCKKWDRKIRSGGKQFISCETPIYGRYVSIKKYSERNKVGRLPICEFMVWGYNYIYVDWDRCLQPSSNHMWCTKCNGRIPPDCTDTCPDNSYGDYCEGRCGHCIGGEKCDKADGKCSKCELGWRPPKCDVPCPNNTYGYGCEHKCGNCEDMVQCDLETGKCPEQCQLWYADEDTRCKTYISSVNVDEQPTVLFRKGTWVMLSLHLDYPYTISQYYTFKLFYLHENDPLAGYQDYDDYTLHYDNITHVVKITINNLLPHTQYWFAVQVFRTHRNYTDAGIPSSPIHFMTLDTDGKENDHKTKDYPKSLPNYQFVPTPKSGDKTTKDQTNQTNTSTKSDIKTAKSSQKQRVIPLHHVSTLTVVLNLVIFIILIAIGVGIGVYFFKKHQRKNHRGLSMAQKDPDNICYSSQIEILDETDSDYTAVNDYPEGLSSENTYKSIVDI